MWPTTDGLRVLAGDEAKLVRGAIGMMLDQLIDEGNSTGNDAVQYEYCIEWFDQWDWKQRVWLLDKVTVALLTDAPPLAPAAMWEATVDAIYCEVHDLILIELDDEMPTERSWRQSAIAAFQCQYGRMPDITRDENDPAVWQILVIQIADAILGLRLYLQAEAYRDAEMVGTRRFLMQKGLPANFLEQIPPLQTIDQSQQSIDRIQSLIID